MTRSIVVAEPAGPLFADDAYGVGFFRDPYDNLYYIYEGQWHLLLDE